MSGSHPGPEFDGPRFDGPARSEPQFLPCYLHPDRQTGITCQRCSRPICMQCMNEATVGFQCPECSGQVTGPGGGFARGGRPTRSRRGGAVTQRMQIGQTPVTWALCGIAVLLAVVDVLTQQTVLTLLGIAPALVESGQLWRVLTYGITSYPILGFGLLTLAINILIMVMIGRTLEPALGTGRFLAVYFTGVLVGGALFTLIAPAGVLAYGFSAGVLGLIAANAALKLRMGGDIKGDLILLAILVGFSLIVSLGSMYWLIQIGSALGAGAAAWVISAAPQQNRSRTQLLGVAAIWLVGLALVGVRVLV